MYTYVASSTYLSCPDHPSIIFDLLTLFSFPSATVLGPLLGQTYQRAKAADTKEEFLRSKEASGAAVAWGTSLVGSALQSYGVGALINATGTLSYKGAAYLGSLIFLATSAPTVSLCLLPPFLASRQRQEEIYRD